ncbi:MAG: hypothetical protein JKY67_21885 [Pseudomonadales bacterium]|nr:hypothetical protein [Pseudomonadales bacterium]
MSTNDSAYSNMHLISAGLLTAVQLFTAAKLFDAANEYYGAIMLFNSALLPLWMGFKKSRRINNIIPMFRQLIYVGVGGFLLSVMLTIVVPRWFIESTPIFHKSLSTLVALSATLPASMIPFSVALFAKA